MVVTPNSRIRLLKSPLELDNENQLTFDNVTSQTNYFLGLTYLEEDNCTYQRKDGVIRFETDPNGITYEDLLKYNYVMYQNTSYDTKWFYGFITKIRYVNDGMTEITIETDVFQSWQFDIVYKSTFVEREHVNDDSVGKNIIDENLQLGEFICNKKQRWLNDSDSVLNVPEMCIVMGASSFYDGTLNSGVLMDGIYSGIRYYSFKNDTTGISTLNTWLENYASNSKLDAIQCLFMIPRYLCTGYDRTDHLEAGSNTVTSKYINHDPSLSSNKTIDFTQSTLDGYTPKNNKLKTYPYLYMLCSNNSGIDVIYRYEDFYTINNNIKTIQTPKFTIISCLTPSGSIRLIPENYKGTSYNDEEGINMGKFPICSWSGDVYTNWLTQNGVNIGLSIAGSLVSSAAGVVTGSAVGVASGILGVANTLGEIYKESKIPPQANGNINSGDVLTAIGKNDFTFYAMSIKKEIATVIDNFFSMYGYKVNDLKIPNITGRTYWNYVKTINCNLEGQIPQEDMQKIKQIFNNGITLWHNPSYFLDYSQNNTIVS